MGKKTNCLTTLFPIFKGQWVTHHYLKSPNMKNFLNVYLHENMVINMVI